MRHIPGARWRPRKSGRRLRRATMPDAVRRAFSGRETLPASRVFHCERIDVGRQYLDLRGGEPLVPGGHVAFAAAMYGGYDGPDIAAIDPVVVGEVRRTHLRVALGVLSMAGGACRQEYLPARLDLLDALGRRVVRMAERIDIGGDVV